MFLSIEPHIVNFPAITRTSRRRPENFALRKRTWYGRYVYYSFTDKKWVGRNYRWFTGECLKCEDVLNTHVDATNQLSQKNPDFWAGIPIQKPSLYDDFPESNPNNPYSQPLPPPDEMRRRRRFVENGRIADRPNVPTRMERARSTPDFFDSVDDESLSDEQISRLGSR